MNNDTKHRRLYMLVALTVAAAGLGFVAFGNIGQNLVYYWDPTQLVAAGVLSCTPAGSASKEIVVWVIGSNKPAPD